MTEQMQRVKIPREEAAATEFGAHLEPQIRVDQGESFLVETRDASSGGKYPNPLAGPIYVEGLEAGDLLVLEIEDIIPGEEGWTGFLPTLSNLARNSEFPELQQPYTCVTHHRPGPSGTTSAVSLP